MGVLDKWLSRFLRSEDRRVDADDHPVPPQRPTDVGRDRTARVGDGESWPEPLEQELARARARLSADASGRMFAEGPELEAAVAALDAEGRSKAADDLIVDATLVSPSLKLRRQLAERLIYRGERTKARAVLEKLVESTASDADAHAAFAYTALGEIAETEGDIETARRCYERVLAIDITLAQPKTRARRLRAQDDVQRADDGRRVLARFLGARAAGARYAVVDEIGRGGAASVFRARDRIAGREVALKIFHARGDVTERRNRIREEARIAGAFDHPHVVPVLDVDEERDLLVMALCDGGSVQRQLQHHTTLGHEEAVELGAVLLRTLADVHDAGHLHLDVKPSNLLFHAGTLMLSDFGTAGMRDLGTLAGTRAYMAPEHTRSGTPTPQADLYAAGLVVVECIEGRLPAPGTRPRLEALPHGPRRRALEEVLGLVTAPEPAVRPDNGRLAADLLLQAGALPLTDAEGAALHDSIAQLAARHGADAVQRLQKNPLISALQPRSPQS